VADIAYQYYFSHNSPNSANNNDEICLLFLVYSLN